ncbi:uncharacterized protein A4U43_C10F920 [Asparagus officinalis]|uniref:Uncharacterized protein n=1 Tax=Asparagus officinalis TaxID=4686 RepID=A0A5P1DZM9_ASPOF|nr:uncharacterized protein A4U43_C10F920 [Asparagus officinalis]
MPTFSEDEGAGGSCVGCPSPAFVFESLLSIAEAAIDVSIARTSLFILACIAILSSLLESELKETELVPSNHPQPQMNERRDLLLMPDLNVSGDCACTFTYLPTDRECTVSVVNRVDDSSLNVSMCRVGGEEWNTQMIPDVSSNYIGRSMRVMTCSHTHDDLCSDSCPSPKKKNTIVIYDPEKHNNMWYKLLTKEIGYSKMDGTTKSILVRDDEVISKHKKEWWQRSGAGAISIAFDNRCPGTSLIRSPRGTFDETVKFEVVEGSFLVLKI